MTQISIKRKHFYVELKQHFAKEEPYLLRQEMNEELQVLREINEKMAKLENLISTNKHKKWMNEDVGIESGLIGFKIEILKRS